MRPENVWDDEERGGRAYPHLRHPDERCPKGYHLVLDHFRNRKGESSMVLESDGVYVKEYCAKNPKRRK